MSRRKKSKGNPVWFLIPALLIAMGAGYFVLHQGGDGASLRTVEQLNPDLYLENANSLRGNTYKMDVEIESSLGNSPKQGRLFSVHLNSPSKSGVPVILPVLIPPALGTMTIQKGQKYLMKVKVVESGLLEVESATKP
jgi:hypothetical protein